MGNLFAVTFSGQAETVQQDLFEVQPADDKPVKLKALYISQETETGDSAEEMLRIEIIRGHTSSGSGGASATPAGLSHLDPTASFSAETNNTTKASAGTTETLHVEAFNVRAGLVLIWPDGQEPGADQGDTTIVVRLNTTPADSITLNGTLIVEEG